MELQDTFLDGGIKLLEVDGEPRNVDPAVIVPAARPIVDYWLTFLTDQNDPALKAVIEGLTRMKTVLAQEPGAILEVDMKDAFRLLHIAMEDLGYAKEPQDPPMPEPTTPVNRPRRLTRLSYALMAWRYA